MNHTRPPTKYERERIEAMKPFGCVACAVLGVPNLNHLELHHILDGGQRMGHYFSIFLCRGHHQGDWSDSQLEWIEPKHRYAISDGRKLFNAAYGSERELWERVQNKLKLPKVWPASKILPRRDHGQAARVVADLACEVPETAHGPGAVGSALGGMER